MTDKQFVFVGLGYCNVDRIFRLPEFPLDRKIEADECMVLSGGPAATATVAAARLGVATTFIGAVGDDENGRRIAADFDAENVDTARLVIQPGRTSPHACCWVENGTGRRSIAFSRGSVRPLTPGDADLSAVSSARILHLDGHHPELAIAAAKLARRRGALVNLDADDALVEESAALMPFADILIASEHFARRWSGESDLEKAVMKMAGSGAKVVGATRGEAGSLFIVKGRIVRVPAFRVDAVDSTGAGDVFHSAFGIRYMETGDTLESARFASAVAAMKCTKLGGRPGIPTRPEVETFLNNH
ncbi:MAG: carbohydrate kinase family protein [Victivallaceae bacterium]